MSLLLDGWPQFSMEEISEDRVKCKLRYLSETHFSRVTDTTSLKDRVPRGFFKHLPHINNWAHGCANLYKPYNILARDTFFDEMRKQKEEVAPKRSRVLTGSE